MDYEYDNVENPPEHLNDYHDRTSYDSNCCEFWAPLTDKALPGVEIGRYSISTYGRIYDHKTNSILKLTEKPSHKSKSKVYYHRSFNMENGKQVTRMVHRLELKTFTDCDYDNLVVDHINDNGQDNRIINLRWATTKENTDYAVDNGLFDKVPKEDIKKILELAYQGYNDTQICEAINHKWAIDTIQNIRSGSKQYVDTINELGLNPLKYKDHLPRRRFFTEEEAIRIYHEIEVSSMQKVAEKYKCGYNIINAIARCKDAYSFLSEKYGLPPIYKYKAYENK